MCCEKTLSTWQAVHVLPNLEEALANRVPAMSCVDVAEVSSICILAIQTRFGLAMSVKLRCVVAAGGLHAK